MNAHTKTPRTDPSQWAAYLEAGATLIPLHAWNAVRTDKKGNKREAGKMPLDSGWQRKTYKSAETIQRAKEHGLNVGVRLPAGMVVVEYDPRRDPKGAEWPAFCKEFGIDERKTPTVISGSGGRHLYMRLPMGTRVCDTVERFKAIEFKSLGRQMVAAGSLHPLGNLYYWAEGTPPLTRVPMAPGKLVETMRRPDAPESGAQGGVASPEKITEALAVLDVESYRDHSKWFQILCSVHHASGGEARQEFIDWCVSDPDYADQEEVIGRRFDSLHAERSDGFTVRTLNKALADAGRPDLTFADGTAQDDFESEEAPDPSDDGLEEKPVQFTPTPYVFRPASEIPARQWLYKPAYIRGFIGLTTAVGGAGKSTLVRTEAAAMASGKSLLGIQPDGRFRTWYWNGEDPRDELERGFAGIRQHYGLKRADLEGHLYVDSGRELQIKVATMQRGDVRIATPVIDGLIGAVRSNRIDVLIIDPFVSSHAVNENDNMAMDTVAKKWAYIADVTNCAVHLVHHNRKSNGEAATIEASRGASAVPDAARVRRVINPMSATQAGNAGIPEEERFGYFAADYRTSSLVPPGDSIRWFKFESVNIGNGEVGDGDTVGVVTAVELEAWTPDPDAQDAALAAIREGGQWHETSRGQKWVGLPIARACGLNASDPADRKKLNRLIAEWLASGFLERREGRDEHRNSCSWIVAAQESDFG